MFFVILDDYSKNVALFFTLFCKLYPLGKRYIEKLSFNFLLRHPSWLQNVQQCQRYVLGFFDLFPKLMQSVPHFGDMYDVEVHFVQY